MQHLVEVQRRVTGKSRRKLLQLLVAEDEPNDVALLSHALHANDIQATAAVVSDGEQVIQYLKGEGEFADRCLHPFPDLVLLDLKMPFVDGVEVLKWIQSRPLCASLPVLMLSGSGLPKDIDEAYRLGVHTYFTKPLSLSELGALLDVIVEYWSRAQRPKINRC